MESDIKLAQHNPFVDETHNPSLISWLKSANGHPSFPIQNLPFGVFIDAEQIPRCGVAIGDFVINLHTLGLQRIFSGKAQIGLDALRETCLQRFMSLGREFSVAFRQALSNALTDGSQHEMAVRKALIPSADVSFCLPCQIGDYTDFYSSIHHATSVGKLFRPNNPLLPNYKWLPIGYHGRASSIHPSGIPVFRPIGQTLNADTQQPELTATAKLDYEVELGIFIGQSTESFEPVCIQQADAHFFGVSMLNDWSARDIQAWEYQPLGPFLSKNFISSISPWIITAEALAPFRVPPTNYQDRPEVVNLQSNENSLLGGFDIQMTCHIRTEQMRHQGIPAFKLSQTTFKHAFWTIAQMITHHTQTGCNLNSGDLLGSGTQSGPTESEAGSLLEITQGGQHPIHLPSGEKRFFLEDGDEIEISGYCQSENGLRIGIGSVSAVIYPPKNTKPTQTIKPAASSDSALCHSDPVAHLGE
ncbi:fumarylacetoacetase [Aliiglaciecola sp. NS0011-25]|uniref:fumarylacetoacetase n=1 Tax=Aliiglaciecola sp. NS0011-25 TaxID=3127654 RepID=UPI0031036E97